MKGSEVLRVLVGFADELRSVGIVVEVVRVELFARSLDLLGLADVRRVHAAARATLLTRREDTELFDAAFARFWGVTLSQSGRAQKMPLAPRHDRRSSRSALATLLSQRSHASDPEISVEDRTHTATSDEALRKKDFSQLTEEELAAVRRLLRYRRFDFMTRETRRRRSNERRGVVDLRRYAQLSARRAGLSLALPRSIRRVQPRPLVVLADVSGSMEIYSRVLLQFFHALGRARQHQETFLFATRLSRVTAELSLRHVDQALDEVGRSVLDFGSGTRIGECLGTFNRRWAKRALRRGALVIIVSDGWETGSVEQLAHELQVLRRACHRLTWLNPRLGETGYEPRVRGMAAALDHVDDFLSCHNLQSLEALAKHLDRLPRGRRRASTASSRPALITRSDASTR